MENSNEQTFWQFSDQLRSQTAINLANLSLNKDSIWSSNSNSYASKRAEARKNFDVRVGGQINYGLNCPDLKPSTVPDLNGWNNDLIYNGKSSHLNMFNDGYNSLDLKPSSDRSNLNNMLNNGWNSALKPSLVSGSDGISRFNEGWNNNYSLKPSKGTDYVYNNHSNNIQSKGFNYNYEGWKIGSATGMVDGLNRGIYNTQVNSNYMNLKGYKNNNIINNDYLTGKSGMKKNGRNSNGSNNSKKNDNKDGKKFNTLPASESLPKDETIGGYIFVCNNDTMQENLKRQLFGLPPRYRDSVRSITPGMPLFLYNYSTHQLHGVFEAIGFGGINIDPMAWEDKKCPGESRFPAQVRVVTKEVCEPLEEDSFRPILHHYDGPKFRLELTISETLALLDVLRNKTDDAVKQSFTINEHYILKLIDEEV